MPDHKPQPLDYANPMHIRRDTSKFWNNVLQLVALALMLIALILIFMPPPMSRASGPANIVKCASNLRQIGQACLLYANDHNGQFPNELALLLPTEDLGSRVLNCPSSNTEPAPGTPAEAAALIRAYPDKHVSFVYLGAGLTTATITPETILAYEPLANHDDAGGNFLFGDGHVEFIAKPQAQKLIAALQAGQNPPPSLQPAP